MRITSTILLCLACAALGASQTKAPAAPSSSSLNKAQFEAYLRYLDLYRVPVTYKIDDPKPSRDIPGFFDVQVHLTFEGGSKDELYYVSHDGQTFLQGEVYKLNRNPFQPNLDRLALADAPTATEECTGSPTPSSELGQQAYPMTRSGI